MKGILSIIAVISMGVLAFTLLAPARVIASVTTTIIGWNIPNGTTFGNGLVGLMLPLAMMGLFAGIPLIFKRTGDFVVTLALVGLFVGSLFGMLSLTASNATNIPFALPVVSGLFLILWIWRGGGK